MSVLVRYVVVVVMVVIVLVCSVCDSVMLGVIYGSVYNSYRLMSGLLKFRYIVNGMVFGVKWVGVIMCGLWKLGIRCRFSVIVSVVKMRCVVMCIVSGCVGSMF